MTESTGSTLVHELIYVGVGDGFYSANPEAMTDQQDINITLAEIYDGCSNLDQCHDDLCTS